jgi:threonylcarbamoyladenosine tRNA methylthiotransferase MtaB
VSDSNPRIAVITFGCKVNQYESACIYEPFRLAGWDLVDDMADVYVVNTCTVTGRTDFKARNAIRKALAHKENDPRVKVFVTGCYAQRFPGEIAALGPVDGIIDNQNKFSIFDRLSAPSDRFDDIFAHSTFAEAFTGVFPEHARAFVKVQDGCDCRCAYCAVPLARGIPRSRTLESSLNQVQALVEAGYHEIVLGGINLGLWGTEWEQTLSDLLGPLTMVSGLDILRLSSIEPHLIDDRLLRLIGESPVLAPHYHIPMQTGSDTLLTAMGRRYDTTRFREVIEAIRRVRPDAALGFDVIVGLPGETDALFAETLTFLQSLDFAYLHVFAYSKRPGTRAEAMPNQVHGTVTRERSRALISLSDERREAYRQRLLSDRVPLRGIAESVSQGYVCALSDHYARIYVKAGEIGSLIEGIPNRVYRDGLETGE